MSTTLSSVLQHGMTRLLSFILASTLSAVILIRPQLFTGSHGMLIVLMWAIAAGFIHGVGYVPVHRFWQLVFGPLLAIPVMIAGMVWFALGT
jgi:cyd operon protein YbgE